LYLVFFGSVFQAGSVWQEYIPVQDNPSSASTLSETLYNYSGSLQGQGLAVVAVF
jgi:hypothetical protein